ncbi:hypothetical protein Emin_0289 [Elusimicrobium minutum Pei191]|uniref:Peptidase C39-like domain-containing protein n=1 Tax=Elusimicrobium minutum (strain Pei191) TaxID=445932 RepID=B2KBU6_ELUMP|nr:hypothetical protein [Elusimicrobium minutum]ACC97850.1 hypothetical protein Emin_0289 [Elusimicrobium minutum Pei191]
MPRIKLFNISALLLLAGILAACATGGRQLKCNIHVIDLTKQRGIYLPNTTANGIDNYLKTSPKWQKIPRKSNGKLNHDSAYEAARKGKTVLATYNTGNSRNGHIVMVYGKKKPAWSNTFKAVVPYSSGSVQGKKPKITLLSYQFRAEHEPKMNYYIYLK